MKCVRRCLLPLNRAGRAGETSTSYRVGRRTAEAAVRVTDSTAAGACAASPVLVEWLVLIESPIRPSA